MTDAVPAEFVLSLGALLPLAALVVSSFLGAYVLGLSPRRSANQSAFLVMLAFIISGMSATAFGPSARIAPTYAYLAPFFGVWMFSSVLVFVRSWWRVRKTPSRSMQSVVVLGLILGTVPAAITELAWPVLTGTDTRLGLGSLYTMMWSIFIAYAVARYRYLAIEPVVEVRPARAPRHRLERGLNYLVLG